MFFSFFPILKGRYENPIIVEMNILEKKKLEDLCKCKALL